MLSVMVLVFSLLSEAFYLYKVLVFSFFVFVYGHRLSRDSMKLNCFLPLKSGQPFYLLFMTKML